MNKGWAIWLTGIPASGKSMIARLVSTKLAERGVQVQILESDAVRSVLTPSPTYSSEDREVFYTSLTYIGALLVDNGVNVIFDATANRRHWRDAARSRIGRFLEVYLDCPLETCRERDYKGIYRLVDSGEARYVPGAQQEYEPPTNPEVTLDCREKPDTLAEKVVEVLEGHGFV